uniref:Uncharacterized protein n=1 Tax=viral metagenome TaxID=1070528 RepID=A0A6C0AE59_9ZZZZ
MLSFFKNVPGDSNVGFVSVFKGFPFQINDEPRKWSH